MLLKILRILKLEQTIDYVYKQNKTNELGEIISIFDVVQSPSLSSPPVNLEESWSLKISFNNKFCVKKLWLSNYFEQDLLFFVFQFKYDAEIIKTPSSYSFGKKVE